MYNFQTISNIIGAIIALYVGIVGVFFNKWGTEFNACGFEWMYRKTKWSVFKLQAEGTRSLPMRIFIFIIGTAALIIGVTTLLSNIYI
ncbi:MAG: hypothetical protein ABIO57_04195 [Candidatus Paceibacterota bacterium]